MSERERLWLIWSLEHRAWWAPGHRGYTSIRTCAGRYTEAEAREIVNGANRYLPESYPPNEAMVPDFAEVDAERERAGQ